MPRNKAPMPEVLWCGNRSGAVGGWSFPPKVRHLLRDLTAGKKVLHPFGGMADFGMRLDIDPLVRPDVIGDAWMLPFRKDSFDVVILDPPYVTLNAQRKNALMRAAGWVAKEQVIWFHTIWSWAHNPGMKLERSWLVRVGDGCFIRCIQVFNMTPDKLPPVKYFVRGPEMKYNRWLIPNYELPFA